LGVKYFDGRVGGSGLSRNLLTKAVCWGICISECGVKIFARLFFKSSALSVAEDANPPDGFISGVFGA